MEDINIHPGPIEEIPEEVIPFVETIAPPPDIETASEDEFVETFIDSQGTLREPSQPIVLLDKEAREAIDDFFVEHHAYADTIETTIDLAVQLRHIVKESESYNRTGKIFETIQSPTSIRSRVDASRAEAAKNNPAEQPVEDQSVETESLAPTPLQELTTFMDITSDDLPYGSSFAQIMKYLDRLPADARRELADINLSGLKIRLSSNARSEAISRINENISAQRGSKSREITAVLTASLTSSLTESLTAAASAVASAESGDDNIGSSRLITREGSLRDIGINPYRPPVQNETLLGEFNENLSAVLQDLSSLGSAEDSALETLTSRDALAAIQQLSPEDQTKLFEEVSKIASYLLTIGDGQLPAQRVKQALEIGKKIDGKISAEIESAINTVFREQALPTLYVSDKEKDRLRDLIGKYNDFIPGNDPRDKLDSAEQERRMLSLEGFTVVSASQMICHATSYAAEILESGVLRTKQRQLDNGVLHEQQMAASQSGSGPNGLDTHSSVPHFSEGYNSGYLIPNEGSTSGIFLVPMSAIVDVAPYDSEGRLLRVLPSAPGSRNVGVTNITPTTARNDDRVFYSSPVYDESDDYEIPVDNSLLVIVQTGDQEIRIPENFKTQVKIVRRASEHLNDLVVPIGTAIHGLIAEHRSDQPKSVVIPLRAGVLEFTPEVPSALRGRFKPSPIGRVLSTGGQTIDRKHINDRTRGN